METIEKKLEENQSLITEAESYFIASTKEVEIAKDRIRVLVMLKETIEPLRESANKTHKQCTQYISTIKKAIEGYEQAIGIYLEVLKEEARLKEEEIKKQLSEEDLPVLVNVEMPTDIKKLLDETKDRNKKVELLIETISLYLQIMKGGMAKEELNDYWWILENYKWEWENLNKRIKFLEKKLKEVKDE